MFISAENYESIEAVDSEYPAAAHIEEVDGGWMAFETSADYEVWQGQE
jgi:hypothetical protein